MNNTPMNILTNGWGERFLSEISEEISPSFTITRLRNDLKETYSDYTSFRKLQKHWDEFPIIHMNCWFDIFHFFRKNKKNLSIFESHSLHPGLNNTYARAIIESPYIRSFVWVFGWLFSSIFRRNIKNVDLYFVSTPGFLESAKKIRNDVIWLPNPVYIPEKIERRNTLGLSSEKINIFYPTGLRSIKSPTAAFELLENLKKLYNNIRIYIFRPESIPPSLQDRLSNLKEDIVWLEKADQEMMREYYLHDWNLVIGSLYPEKPYAILNMIELEAMAYELPIVAIDHYEILKYPLSEIGTISKKLIEDTAFQKEYKEKNITYIRDVHSSKSVGERYLSLLESRILP